MTNHSVIGKYERDEVNPSIDAVKRLADELDTTVAYLIGEAGSNELFRDQDMLRRLKEINSLPKKDKECILYNLDDVLRDVKTRLAYSQSKGILYQKINLFQIDNEYPYTPTCVLNIQKLIHLCIYIPLHKLENEL